jgi:hypothetical protein
MTCSCPFTCFSSSCSPLPGVWLVKARGRSCTGEHTPAVMLTNSPGEPGGTGAGAASALLGLMLGWGFTSWSMEVARWRMTVMMEMLCTLTRGGRGLQARPRGSPVVATAALGSDSERRGVRVTTSALRPRGGGGMRLATVQSPTEHEATRGTAASPRAPTRRYLRPPSLHLADALGV